MDLLTDRLRALRRHSFGAPRRVPNLLVRAEWLTLAQALPAELCDLIYVDPPFFSGRDYADTAGAFADSWQDDLEGYLAWLMARLAESWRLLRPEGSLFVHLDRRAVHYVKVELDRLCGRRAFRNEIIWHYTGGGRSRRVFSHKHDTLLWYSKGRRWTFHIDAVRQPYAPTSGYARSGIVSAGRRYLPHPQGTPADDVWNIPIINPLSAERLGYPTQKPERLLERIIAACSSPGDMVADFVCGSGTTPAVAQRLGRRWLAADHSAQAIKLAEARLRRTTSSHEELAPDFVVAFLEDVTDA
ncbi:MAG: hypothetical protein KatS3mg057_1934 [Herpetosiphonaceae bacterium]|nr:MAG: hypothetical protein KatS3mg057_1934 [Herpetosiphonaceae bacterium]